MKFYSISESREINVIGFYPQTSLAKSYNPTSENSHRNVKPYNFSTFTPDYGLELNEQAIPTDIIDRGPVGFGLIVNEKIKELLKDFELPEHKFYPINISYKNKGLKYYWFHFIADIEKYIDKSKSTIKLFHKFKFNIIQEEIYINTIKGNLYDYEDSLPREHAIRINKIVMNSDTPVFDIFDISILGRITLISEKLKDKLYKEGITGSNIMAYDKLIF